MVVGLMLHVDHFVHADMLQEAAGMVDTSRAMVERWHRK